MTHKLNRLTALVLAVIMAFSVLLVPVSASSFNDVSDGAWYKAAVDYVQERGWMAGVSDTSFAPKTEVTRGMMVTVLARIAGAETDNDNAAFSDTPAGKWYTGAAAWAAENGIVSGVGNGKFAPNRAITRQDLCVMLDRYLEVMGIELEDTSDRGFSDLNRVAEYALPAMIRCAGKQLISGFEDSTIRPKDTANRAQVAQLMMRMDMLVNHVTEPMPAQSFNGEGGNGMAVSIEAPEGALPEDTEMTVSAVSDERSLEVLKDLAECGRVLAASNITFTKGGEDLQPKTAVQVQLSLTDLQHANNPAVVHLKHDGSLEYVDSVLISTNRAGTEKALSFEATDFSVYAVVDGDTNNDSARLVVKIWKRNEAGTAYEVDKTVMVTRQDVDNLATIIPDGESPVVYGKEIFCGWYVDKANFDGANAHVGYDAEDADGQHTMDAARDSVKEILEDPRFTIQDAVTTVHIYPIVLNYFVVSLVDENGGTTYETKIIYTTGDEVTYVPQLVYAPYEQGYRFIGWQKDDGDDTVYPNGANVPITQQKTILRAQVQPGQWLTFVENPSGSSEYKGATYNPPVFCVNGDVLKSNKPADPTVPGYTFDCWCTDAACTQEFDFFKATNTAQTYHTNVPLKLYARWTADTSVPYTIIVWKQKVSDAKDAADNGTQKYDYYYSVTKYAAPGTSVTSTTISNVLANYQNKGDQTVTVDGQTLNFTGFKYNGTKDVSTDTTIQRKGTTVLNVYYDRQLVTINFYTPTYTRLASSSRTGFGNVYALVDGYYYRILNATSNGDYAFYEIPRADMKTSVTYYASEGGYIRTISYSNGNWVWDSGNYSGQVFDFSKYNPYVRISTPTYFYQVSYSSSNVQTYTGLFESTLADNGYTWPNSYWWYNKLYSGTSYTYTGFPTGTRLTFVDAFVPNGTSYTQDLYGSKTKATAKIYFYQENKYPDLGNYTVKNDPESGTTSFLLSDKYAGFTCYRYSTTSSNGPWTEVGDLLPYEEGSSELYYDADPITPTTFDKVTYLEQLHIQFKRNQYSISYLPGKFVDGDGQKLTAPVSGTFKVVDGIYYQQSISSYGKNGANYYDPTKTGDFVTQEWVLEGWYDNPECSDNALHDFSGEDMPAHNITLYGKFRQVQYRVILHYNIPTALGVSNVSATNNLKESYRVTFNDMIDGGQTIDVYDNRVDPEYILVGWYTDAACTHPFTFTTHLTNASTVAYDKTVDMTDCIGIVPGTPHNADITGYNGGDRFWITQKLDLYAKWRRIMAGADGITVQYDAIQQDVNGDGTFAGEDCNPDYLWTDPLRYMDDTDIMARSASTPNQPDNFKFDHWEIMKPTSAQDNTLISAGKDPVYPGQPFRVSMDDAAVIEDTHSTVRVEAVAATCMDGHVAYWRCRRCGKLFWDEEGAQEITDPNANYNASNPTEGGIVLPGTGQHTLTAHEGVTPTCVSGGSIAYWSCSVCGKLFSDANGSTEVTEDDLALAPTGVHTWGAYTYDETTHYHECYVCHTVESEVHSFTETVVAPTVTEQGYTRHTCGICGYHYDDNILPALGADYTVTFSVLGDITVIAPMTSNTNTGITLPTASAPEGYTFLGWVANPIATPTTQRPTILTGSYTAQSDITLHAVYTYSEPNGTYIYQLTDGPEDGEEYILVGQSTISGTTGRAVGNSIVTNNRYLNAVSVTINSDDTCTVSNVGSVLWKVAAITNGYSFYNEAAGKYMGLDSSEYLYPSNTALAWAYTDEGYLDNQTDSEGYYYLGYDSSETRYTTNKSGQVIKFYQKVEGTTDYYVTSISGTHVHQLTPVAAVEATCGTPGNIAYWRCVSGCGGYFSDAAGEHQILASSVVIPATGEHTSDNDPVSVSSGGHAATEPTRGVDPVQPVTADNDIWVPTDSITAGADYLIGIVYNGNTYLAVNKNVYNSSAPYNASFNNTESNDRYYWNEGYMALAQIEDGKVVGVNSANVATDLQYCVWKFSSSSGGTITSGAESNYHLYYGTSTVENDNGNWWTTYYDYTYNTGVFTDTSTWTWDSTNKRLSSNSMYMTIYEHTKETPYTYYLDYTTTASEAGQIQLYKRVASHTLTVNYAAVGGTPSDLPGTYTVQVPEGSTYTAPVPTIEGFTPDLPSVSGTMGTSDVTVTVTYYRDGGSWKWVPTDSIVVGEEYLIGFEVDGKVYLILSKNTSSPAGSSYYYYMPSTYSGYTVLATRDEHSNVTGCSGWTNALDYCQWSFSSTTGGTITSVMEPSYKLGVYADAQDLHATTSTSALTGGWVWNASDNTLSIPASSTVTKYASYKASETYNSTAYNNFCTAATAPSANTKVVLYSLQYFVPNATHTVTFWDDYTDSEISHVPVNDGEGVSAYPTAPDHTDHNYVFAGWDTELSELEHVYADVTVTAHYVYSHEGFYTVEFLNWDGTPLTVTVNGQQVTVQEVEEGHDAVEPAHPSRTGLEFKGWDHDFHNVTQNLVIRPIFGTEVTTTYLVTLHAIYTPIVPLEKTHVTWYANNGATLTANDPDEVYKNSTEVVINNAIDIEDQDSWKKLTKTGYTFLGWARMPEMESMVEEGYADRITLGSVADVMPEGATEQTYTEKIVAYEGLTPNDLWLVYHPAQEGAKAGEEDYFTVREKVVDENNNVTYVELTNASNENNAFEHIAANENDPYHGLYAVWQRDVFYVLHSSDGKLEAVTMPVGTGEATQGMGYAVGTTDLTSFVRPGYLYGGYYTNVNNDGYAYGYVYGYVQHDDVQDIADSYSNAQLNGWSNVASTASLSTAAVIGTNSLHTSLPTGKNFINYTGNSLYTNGTNKPYVKDNDGNYMLDPTTGSKVWRAVWNGADAAQADGTNLRPQVGKVYYLKEVPPQYLTSRMLYTYDTAEGQNNKLLNVWIVTLLDDNNYKCDASNTGFYVNSGSADTTTASDKFQQKNHLSASFTITQQASNTDPVNHPAVVTTVNASSFGREGGFVMATQMTALTGVNNFTMLPTWTTPDGVKVYNNGLTFTKNSDTSDGTKLYTWARSFDGTEKMYFNLNGNHGMGGEDEWKDYAAQIVHFVGPNGNDDDVRAYEIGSTGVFAISVPAGNWTEFLLVRCDSGSLNADFSNMWNNGVKWNQTGNIPIPNPSSGYSSYVNYLTDFTAGGTTGTWSYYPSNPS